MMRMQVEDAAFDFHCNVNSMQHVLKRLAIIWIGGHFMHGTPRPRKMHSREKNGLAWNGIGGALVRMAPLPSVVYLKTHWHLVQTSKN